MLKTKFLNQIFSNPLVLASGIIGLTAASLKKASQDGAGGVTIKSVSLLPRPGHSNPTMIATNNYFLNAVGLSNPGVKEAVAELKIFKKISRAPLIGSIFAGTPEEFGNVAEQICMATLDFLEVDISCPNVSQEFGDPFAHTPSAIESITKKVKAKANVPIIIKLSPHAWNIAKLAKVAEASGADALNIGNTIGGMSIDVKTRKPILNNYTGGVSGPALFPIALRCVYETYQAVKIPIIGTGGVTTGEDALAMIMAGATLVGVGSAVYYRGATAFKQIADEMKLIMKTEKIKNLDSIRGAAHN